jgi:hypothetical protein
VRDDPATGIEPDKPDETGNLPDRGFIGMLGTQIFWGTNVRAPIGG